MSGKPDKYYDELAGRTFVAGGDEFDPIKDACCPECGEKDNLYHTAEVHGVEDDLRFLRVWLECQECEAQFFVTRWDEPDGA